MEVGIREFRDNLSRYIGLVRDGSELVVTDHGNAVAQVIPLDRPRTIDSLVASGLVTRASTSKQQLEDEGDLVAAPGISDLVVTHRR